MHLGLEGKTALVAGSSRGLGYAAAAALAAEGANVVVCGRSARDVEDAAAQLAGSYPRSAVRGLAADVTAHEDVAALVDHTVALFGGLDILITNAGGPPGGIFDDIDMAHWRGAVELTLLSAVELIQTSLAHLRRSKSASILTITSFSAKQPVPGLLLSNAMRPAVLGLTKTLSQELGPDGIRVNSILPGWTATERVAEIMEYRAGRSGTSAEQERGKVTAGIPLGRMADPAEFGRVAAFLVSPAASYITGAMVPVDGGICSGLL